MKEYWVNVYKDNLIGVMQHETILEANAAAFPPWKHAMPCIYRIHVKMKEPWQSKREYEYKFNFNQLIYSETRGRYDTYDYFKVKGIKRHPAMTTKPNKHWMDN